MRERRSKRLNLKVSEEWYDLVEQAAGSYGLSMTDVIMYATKYFLELKPAPDITFTQTKRGRKQQVKSKT
jgi:hypothetical protein